MFYAESSLFIETVSGRGQFIEFRSVGIISNDDWTLWFQRMVDDCEAELGDDCAVHCRQNEYSMPKLRQLLAGGKKLRETQTHVETYSQRY